MSESASSLSVLDGRFEVKQTLGRGAMGTVVLVSDMADAETVPYAAKILEAGSLHPRFVAEVKLLRTLSHPTFVTAGALGFEPILDAPYVLLEACLGPDLTHADPHQRSHTEVLAALLRAVDHLHRLGWAHGDLAPSNVHWNLDKHAPSPVKVLDLGAAERIGAGSGSTSGVLNFAAPERLAGKALSEATDLWSVGALCFQVIHGVHPFPDYPGRPLDASGPVRRGLDEHILDPVLDRLLSAEPAERYPNAASALADLANLTTTQRPLFTELEHAMRLRKAPYVDSKNTRASLLARAQNALSGGNPFVSVVAGGPGSGKSRFLEEIADALIGGGVHVVAERPLPGDALGDILRRIGRRLGVTSPLSPQRQGATVKQLLGALRERGTRALLVDDLDRAGASTQQILRALMRSVQTLPERVGGLVILATCRDARTHHLSSAIALAPWSGDDLMGLLGALFPKRRVSSRVGNRLAELTSGSPALTMHVLQELTATGTLTVDATAVHLDIERTEHLALPNSLSDAWDRTFKQLSATAQRSAALIAWSRRPLSEQSVDGLQELSTHGLVVRRPTQGDIVAVSLPSPQAVDIARQALEPKEAHLILSKKWEVIVGREGRASALHHALRAGQDKALPKAVACLDDSELSTESLRMLLEPIAEGDWSMQPEDVLTCGTAAARSGLVALAERFLTEASKSTDTQLASRSLCILGELLARQARHRDALATFQSADRVGGSEHSDAERLRVLAGLSRSAVLSGALDDAEIWAAEGQMIQADDPEAQGRLAYTRGLVAWYRGAIEDADGLFRRALELATKANDLVEQGAVATALGLVSHRRGELDSAVEHYQNALKIGERAGDEARVLTALQNLGVVFHERGEWVHALDTYREALEFAEALDQPGRIIQLSGNIGNLWRYLGELRLARVALERGLALARTENNQLMTSVILNLVGEVALAHEAWDEAEAHLQEAAAIAQESQSANEELEAALNLARLYLEIRRYESARTAAKRAFDIASKSDSAGLKAVSGALRAAAELRSIHGDKDAGEAWLAEALDGLHDITNPDNQWPVLLEAMWAEVARGDIPKARQHASDARVILRALEDAVPAEHRKAFQALSERRRAHGLLVLALGDSESSPAVTASTTQQPLDRGPWERLLEVNKRLNQEYDVTRLLEYIMDSAILLTGAERGFLLLDEEGTDREKLKISVGRNIDQENVRNVRLKISHGIARRVIESSEAVLTVDAMEDDRYASQLSVHDLKLRSVLCLPMRSAGQVLGALYLDNRFQRAAFGDADLRFMEAFADQAAIALSTARLVGTLNDQAAQLARAQAEVKGLNDKLAGELRAKSAELADTHKVVIRQQKQLEQKHTYDAIIGNSMKLRRVFAIMDRLLDNAIPVLIEGESGTGKELVARAIHFNGIRKNRPFVAVNCGAIPSNLLESELFGHVRGAFTGATADKKGLFEAAHGGTLLLDELGELPLEMQVKLLRALQSGDIKKVGSAREIRVDVRIIAATNRKLEEEVAAGRFREDLYYRLSVVPVELPPLRERLDDVPLLAQHFVALNRASGLGNVTGISPKALSLLQRYSWPGNIRQLEMVLKNASLFAEQELLQPQDFESFPDILSSNSGGSPGVASFAGLSLADIERQAIIAALHEHSGNKSRSAEQLGIDRRTLYNKLKAYNIQIQKELSVS